MTTKTYWTCGHHQGVNLSDLQIALIQSWRKAGLKYRDIADAPQWSRSKMQRAASAIRNGLEEKS